MLTATDGGINQMAATIGREWVARDARRKHCAACE
jgi:hypothetical protein